MPSSLLKINHVPPQREGGIPNLPMALHAIQTAVRTCALQNKTDQEQEGTVVWDNKGIVVVWPDGHRSRFSWAVLRQACPCLVCQKQRAEHEPSPKD